MWRREFRVARPLINLAASSGFLDCREGSQLAFTMESLLMSGNPLSNEDVMWLGEQIAALDAVIAAKG